MAAGLNAAQHEAVETLSGPLLVLAGAGTGKTRVVTFRIANLIRHGIRPNRILAVTFTNKAAAEMQERASALLGKRLPERPEISTFHSLCVRILRRHITRLGYPAQFTIYDRGDQEGLARAVLREIRVAQESLRPGDLLATISRWKTDSLRPDAAAARAETDQEHLAAAGYRRYQKALKLAGAVDFDDLLLVAEELLERFPDVRADEAGRFDHLLIDEYQDTNESQYRIVKCLASDHRNLCVVGDDDQSIYAWRGAAVKHILGFHRDWPEAKIVRLEENYRSTEPILAVANRLIAFNEERHKKILRSGRGTGNPPRIWKMVDEQAESRDVVGEIRTQIDLGAARPRDYAILCRTNEQPRAFEEELRRKKVPYVLLGGQSFYDRTEVKDVLAYLRLLAQPRDEISLRRVINTPPRGIGKTTIEQLAASSVAAGRPLMELLPEASQNGRLPATARRGVEGLLNLLEDHRQRAKAGSLVDMATSLLDTINYRAELTRLHKQPADAERRWNSVAELLNSLGQYEAREKHRATLSGFLDESTLMLRDSGDDKEKALERDVVVLMTLHSAKGLEFPRVYLVGLEDGILPHHRSVASEGVAIDEERRLCYVGVTRAQDQLTISWCASRFKWGKARPTKPSRFLYEITGEAKTAAEAVAMSNREYMSAMQAAGLTGGPKPFRRPTRSGRPQKR